MGNSKKVWKSAELQFYAVLSLMPEILDILAQNISTVQSLMPDNIYKILLFVALAGGAILRIFKTKTAVTFK